MNSANVTSRPLFGIYGASGFGREVLPVADEVLSVQHGPQEYELVFIDDADQMSTLNGRRVLTYDEFVNNEASSRAAAIAIADTETRSQVAGRCFDDGVASFAITASSVVIMDDVQIDEGAILSPFVTLTSNIRIGRHFHANIYSYVAHDCVIGDFVTFAPGVKCNGNVVVEDYAYVGTGAVLRQGKPGSPLRIGRGATVGMGAVVTHDVPAGITVVGNPAVPMTESS